MQEQINQLNQTIASKKESHDFVRGKINAFDELITDITPKEVIEEAEIIDEWISEEISEAIWGMVSEKL